MFRPSQQIPFNPSVPARARFQNLTGKQYGKLTVFGYYGKSKFNNPYWLCRCNCGQWAIISTSNLNKGTSSCGCIRTQLLVSRGRTHGHSNPPTPEYRAYNNARERCELPKNNRYHLYGGRGIEFRFESFEQFLDTVGHRPSAHHSIDRIDTEGHYEPGNVRWATRSEQMLNRRKYVHKKKRVYG